MAFRVIRHIPSPFYVYEIVVDGVPRYIGKGCGERFKEHLRTARRISSARRSGQKFRTSRFYNRLVRALDSGSEIEARLIAEGLEEPAALALEIQEIGKRPKGEIWNTFAGGQGFTSEWLRERWRDPDYRAAQSTRSKQQWQNPEFRENQLVRRNSEDHRLRASASLREALSDPSVRKKMRDRKIEYLSDPDRKQRFVSRMHAGRGSPDRKAKDSAAQKLRWSDSAYKERMRAIHQKSRSDPEIRARISKATSLTMTAERRSAISEQMKAKWRDPEYRAAQIAKRRQNRSL